MSFLPEQTIAYRVYANGSDMLGIATVEFPELKNMSETISGTGIAGEYESPTIGMFGSISAKFNWNSPTDKCFSLLNPFIPLMIECKGSQQMADRNTGAKVSVPVELTLFGTMKGAGLGTMEQTKKAGNNKELEIIRLVYEFNGKQKLLLDKTNMIFAVDGVDLMAKVRADVGLEY